MKLVPLYKLKCKACNKVFEQTSSVNDSCNIKCDECNGNTEIMICPFTFLKFTPFMHPNLDSKPVWIKSLKHLKEESDKRNMTSFY